MRILVLNWQDRENPQAGGAEAHLHEVFGRLADRGHHVRLVASGFDGARPTLTLDGIVVHRVGGRHSYPVSAPALARRLLAEDRFDVVVEDLNKVPLFMRGWLPPGLPGVLLVHHLFGATAFWEASAPVAAATWLLERPIGRAYAGMPTIAVSESTRADLEERGLGRDDISVIRNGIDPTRLTPGAEADRTSYPSLVYLGRLRRYKRVDLILRAVSGLRERGVPVRAVIAGKGPHGAALESLAGRLGLLEGDPPAVEFPGFVSEAHKLELLQSSWVHVLTSPREGWGIANLEAAACGTPTVASDSPGLRDSVRHGETGFLVPHGDVSVLTGCLESVLASDELRRTLGRSARLMAEGLTWDGAANLMEEALDAVARGGPLPGAGADPDSSLG